MTTVNDIYNLMSGDSSVGSFLGNMQVGGASGSPAISTAPQANAYQAQQQSAQAMPMAPVAPTASALPMAQQLPSLQSPMPQTNYAPAPAAPAQPAMPQMAAPAAAPASPIMPAVAPIPTMPAGPGLNPAASNVPMGAAPAMPAMPAAPVEPAAAAAEPPVAALPVNQTVAGAPAPAAAPVAAQGDFTGRLLQAQDNPAELMKLRDEEGVTPEHKDLANRRLLELTQQTQGRMDAEKKAKAMLAANDSKGIANIINRNEPEGSYLKAYMYHRLGLSDLAQQEQIKLGAGSHMQQVIMPDGEQYLVRMRGDNVATHGVDLKTGQELDANQLASAGANYMKDSEVGKTLYKTKNGDIISAAFVKGETKPRLMNLTTNQALASAPTDLAPINQQDWQKMAVGKAQINEAESTAKAMRASNIKAVDAGLKPIYSDEYIDTVKGHLLNGGILAPELTNALAPYRAAEQTQENQNGAVNPNAAAPAVATAAPTAGQTAQDWAKENNIPVSPHGGTRTNDEQWAQYDAWVSNGKKGPPVARPGTSKHETGNAIDVPENGRTTANLEKLKAAGFQATNPSEPWHFERTAVAETRARQLGDVERRGSPALETQAQAIYRGEQPMPTGMGANNLGNKWLQARVQEIAQQQGKPYDAMAFKTVEKARKDWNSGAQSKQIQQFDRASAHVASLGPVIDNLQNTNLPIWNKIANEYAQNTGQTAPVDFSAAKKIVGDEIMKTVLGSGAGTGAERGALQKDFATANSPQQLHAVLDRAKELMAAQGTAMERQYRNATKQTDFANNLGPAAQQILNIGRTRDRETATAGLQGNLPSKAEIAAEKKRRGIQ